MFSFCILHHFHVILFSVVISSCCTFFWCCTLFMDCISCCTFTRCSVFVLHSSPVALLSCCNFFLLGFVHFVYIALFQRCSQDLYKHLRWRALQQQLTKLLNIAAKLSILDVRGRPGYASTISMLHIFHVALTFLILKNIENERKKENTIKKMT